MSAEENKATFRRYVEEVVNQGNLELADEIFDRYLAHQPDGSALERGPEDVKRFQGEFRSALGDLHATVEDQIAEGDKVVARLRTRATFLGECLGFQPTGGAVEVAGVAVHRIADDQIAEMWLSWDTFGLAQQVGLFLVTKSSLGEWEGAPGRERLEGRY